MKQNSSVCTVASVFLKTGTVMEIMTVAHQIFPTNLTVHPRHVRMLNSNAAMANVPQAAGAAMDLMIVVITLMSLNVVSVPFFCPLFVDKEAKYR